MRQHLRFGVLVGIVCLAAGCAKDPALLKAKGRVVKGGTNFIPEEGTVIQLAFVPISADGSPPRNWYVALVDQSTGTFYTSGAHLAGMPPGKYRVVVELKKDRKDTLGGKFDALHTPFEFDVNEKSAEMVIDLDAEPLTTPATPKS